MTNVTAARNKARGKEDERRVARLLGGERHKADTGGPEDVSHPWLSIQVKGGKRVMTAEVRAGVESARVAAVGTTKLPICAVVDRSGTRLRDYIVIDTEDFITWFGTGEAALPSL